MTIKEIANLTNVGETTVRRWISSAKMAGLSAKMAQAVNDKKPADFTLPETIAIIRAGGNETLADLLMENAKRPQDMRPAISREMLTDIIKATVVETLKVSRPALPAPKPVKENKLLNVYQDKDKTIIRYDGEEYQVGKSYYNVAFWDLRVKREGHWHTLKRDFISRAQAMRYLERNF